MFGNLFKSKKAPEVLPKKLEKKPKVKNTRIGDIGEYKINIQLDQLPKTFKYLSDVMLGNDKSKSGYSQIDHLIFTPYAIFVIETKNYTGTIYGDRDRAKWSLNGKFQFMNPFHQNIGHIKAVQALLPSTKDADFISMISFNRRSTFKVNEELRKIQSSDLIVYDTELTEFITRKINVLKLLDSNPVFSESDILEMYDTIKKSNIVDPTIRQTHVDILNRKVQKPTIESSARNCKTCGKEVSEKVQQFCLSNEKRFKGNVYCFEHQKN
ncbi:nuclease-related domain-containing protein [Bacillaceae bacterium CLA-AA-H227]|uniref:Nuclease-related domain-containing protein n=1 Tax=Robertmurraya yapensis (ex Hitch et al 2024) TaxID=3133160 RepID=A0ACC6S559_9BACI